MAEMVAVHLHGFLGERFGARLDLEIASPAEAVRALCELRPGVRDVLAEGAWHLVAGPLERGRAVEEATLALGLGRHRELHIVPAATGAGSGGIIKTIIGVALIGLSFWNPAGILTTAASMGLFGIGVAVASTGVSSFLSPQRKAERKEAGKSFGFSNTPSNTVQGAAVPLIFGEVITEPRLISGSVTADDDGGRHDHDRRRGGLLGAGGPIGPDPADGLSGAGGLFGGGRGKSSMPRSDDDTLRSVATARLLYLVGAGEIEGIVDGAKSIYLNDTPLQAKDGSWNFKGVDWWFTRGGPDQAPPPGQEGVETTTQVGVEVTRDKPVTRTVTNPEADAVRVTVQIPQLYKISDKGAQKATDLYYDIQLRSAGGGWATAVQQRFDNQKTLSAYERSHRIPLTGTGPWDIRVVRVSDDPKPPNRVNPLTWERIAEIVEGKFAYPDCALLALTFDARQFGGELPRVKVHVRGLRILVPANYDPAARNYAGDWNGAFKPAWCSNPAWIARFLLTDPLDGLGAWIGADAPDKWRLYRIARYCDEAVPDGFGGFEPRYAFHDVIGLDERREDAHAVLQSVASSWRGMAWWAGGSVAFSADMPAAPSRQVNQTNVEDGDFTRSETSLSARKTAVQIVWRDPDNLDEDAWEYVDDPEAVRTLGLREAEIRAPGCRSRGLARRLGKWFLETERQDRGLGYAAGADHWDVSPGDVIEQADPVWMGVRWGGRVLAAAGAAVTLDAAVDLEPGKRYRLRLTAPDGKIQEEAVISPPGSRDVLTLAAIPPQAPAPGAVWILAAADLAPPQWRVIEVTPDDTNPLKRRVSALIHDPHKFERIEQGIRFDPVPDSAWPKGRLQPPRNLKTAPIFQERPGGRDRIGVTLSWSPPPDIRASRFAAELRTDAGPWRPVYTGEAPSCDILDLDPGAKVDYRVQSVDTLGGRSDWAYLLAQIPVSGRTEPPGPPRDVQAIGTIGEIRVVFTPDRGRSDFRATEVWAARSDRFDQGWLLAATPDTWAIDTVPPLERRWYWLRTVTHDPGPAAASAWVGPWSAASLQIPSADWLGQKILAEIHLTDELRRPIREVPTITRNAEALRDYLSHGLLNNAVAQFRAEETNADRTRTVAEHTLVVEKKVVEGISAEAIKREALKAEFDEQVGGIVVKQTALANAQEAQASRLDLVSAAAGKNTSAVQTEIDARAEADKALGKRIDTVQASVSEGVKASVQSETEAWANAKTALAKDIKTVQVAVNGHTESIQAIQEAQNGVGSAWTVKAESDGVVKGLVQLKSEKSGGQAISSFAVAVDKFVIANSSGNVAPFAIGMVGGVYTVTLTTAVIGDLSVDTIKIRNGAISTVVASERQGKVKVGDNWTLAHNLKVNRSVAGPVLLNFNLFVVKTSGGGESGTVMYLIKANGQDIRSSGGILASTNDSSSIAISLTHGGEAGETNYELFLKREKKGVDASGITAYAIHLKR